MMSAAREITYPGSRWVISFTPLPWDNFRVIRWLRTIHSKEIYRQSHFSVLTYNCCWLLISICNAEKGRIGKDKSEWDSEEYWPRGKVGQLNGKISWVEDITLWDGSWSHGVLPLCLRAFHIIPISYCPRISLTLLYHREQCRLHSEDWIVRGITYGIWPWPSWSPRLIGPEHHKQWVRRHIHPSQGRQH